MSASHAAVAHAVSCIAAFAPPHEPVLPELADDDLLLFHFAAGAASAAHRSLYQSWLSADETERLHRFHHDIHRNEYLHGRALTRWVLAQYLRCEPAEIHFAHNAFGKPWLPDAPGLFFNLSHSGGSNLLALTRRGPIGVDIEAVDPSRAGDSIAAYCFAPQERQRLLRSAPQHRTRSFFATWTLKESFVKAVGQGLSMPLASFAFDIEGDALQLRLPEALAGDAGWHSALLALPPGLLAAWTLRAPGPAPRSALLDVVPAVSCCARPHRVMAQSVPDLVAPHAGRLAGAPHTGMIACNNNSWDTRRLRNAQESRHRPAACDACVRSRDR